MKNTIKKMGYYCIAALVNVLNTAHTTERIQRDDTIHYTHQETQFLEEATGPAALEWVQEHNQKTEQFLKSTDAYQLIKKQIAAICYDKRKLLQGSIWQGYVYNYWTDAKNPLGLWRRTLLKEYAKKKPKGEVLIDFDELSKKWKKKVVFQGASAHFQQPTRYLVHMSFGGKDEQFFQEWDLQEKAFVKQGFATQNSKGEVLEGKHTCGIWRDPNTLVCNLVLHPAAVTDSGYPHALYIWKRGQPIEEAQKIYEVPKNYISLRAFHLLSPRVNPSLLGVVAAKDFYNCDYFILDEKQHLQPMYIPTDVSIVDSFQEYVFLTLDSDWQIQALRPDGQMQEAVPAGSLVALHWQDLLKQDADKTSLRILFTPTDTEIFSSLSVTKDTVFLNTLENVVDKITTLQLQKGQWTTPQPLPLPCKQAVVHITSNQEEEKAFIRLESPIVPPTIYLWENHELRVIKESAFPFNSADYVSEQRSVTSFDGVSIPYSIVYKKGTKFDGKNPTVLGGYGGFQIINQPYFSRAELEIWVKNGGIIAIAHTRGGGERGPKWHQAAILENRQTAFNDFTAVAKALIKDGITSPAHLGIMGGSNGGLLVSVAMTQCPDLFGAVVCEVPILDMERYTEFGAGPAWIAEYGDPKNPTVLAYIQKYAPLAHLHTQQKYPPVLITTSTLDQRVHPWHARIFKYVLEKHPTAESYLVESSDSGHGSGCSLKDQIAYWATIYTFLATSLGLKIRSTGP